MRAYSSDLRERVLRDCDGGMGTRAVARKYTVSESWVRRLKQVRRDTGRTTPAPRAGGRVGYATAHADAVRAAVAHTPDATLDELRAALTPTPSRTALARALVALGLTRKKSRSGRPSRNATT
jgi:transposase